MTVSVTYNTYQINFEVEGNLIFSGERTIDNKRYKWTLFDPQANIIAEIRLKPYWISFSFNEDFLIQLKGEQLLFRFKAFRAPHFIIDYGNDRYLVVVHKGNILSVFKNKKQIAALIGETISMGFKTVFKLMHEQDIDLSFIATIIYAALCTAETNDSLINFNMGNIGPELLAFNQDWQPGKSNQFT